MAPPARQSRPKRALFDLAVPFVHKQAGHRSGTAVDVFVVTPYGEVHVPIMQLQDYVTHRMRAIPPNQDALGVCMRSNCFDIKKLPSVVLDSWEEN